MSKNSYFVAKTPIWIRFLVKTSENFDFGGVSELGPLVGWDSGGTFLPLFEQGSVSDGFCVPITIPSHVW